jgi:CRISPR-associated protein Cmr2
LIKRLVTVDDIARSLPNIETPGSFQWLNRWKDQTPGEVDRAEAKRWTGWFLGDGDRASDYLLPLIPDARDVLNAIKLGEVIEVRGS